MSSRRRRAPRELAGDWPATPSRDPAAEAIRLFVVALTEAMGTLSLRQVTALTGVNHAAIAKILSGEAWPDARTVALLESGLELGLWPHVGPSGKHSSATGHEVAGVDRTDDVLDGERPPHRG